MTITYLDMEPLSEYSPVTLHLSPATRVLNENPGRGLFLLFGDNTNNSFIYPRQYL